MPAPNPEAPPVISAVFPFSRVSLTVERRHCFEAREAIQRFKSLFPSVPGQADAAEAEGSAGGTPQQEPLDAWFPRDGATGPGAYDTED